MIYDDGTRMTVDDIRARVMKYRPVWSLWITSV